MSDKIFTRSLMAITIFFTVSCLCQISYFIVHISEETSTINIVIKCIASILYIITAFILCVSEYFNRQPDCKDLGYKIDALALGVDLPKSVFRNYLYLDLTYDSNISESIIENPEFAVLSDLVYDEFYKPGCSIWYRQIKDIENVQRHCKKFKSFHDQYGCMEWQVSRSKPIFFLNSHYNIYIDLIEKDKSAILNMLG